MIDTDGHQSDRTRIVQAGAAKRRALLAGVALALATGYALARQAPAADHSVTPGRQTPSIAVAEMSLNDVTRGELLIESSEPGRYRAAPILQTQATIRVTGPIARATLTQRFRNPGNDWVEAIYAFPLPEDAAVDHLRMHIAERVIEGQIREREAARRVYEKAKTEGRQGALVEQHRPNLFTTAVANVPPLGEVSVEIEYQQPLHWRDERFSLRFPMAITPRYRPGPRGRLQETSRLTGGWAILPGEVPNSVPLRDAGEPAPAPRNPVRLRVELQPGFPLGGVTSRYHDIEHTTAPNGSEQVRLADAEAPSDRDFVLEWTAATGSAPRAAFFTEHTPAGDYGLLMLMPPGTDGDGPAIDRQIVFVIDTSGSMGGASIRQAKAALTRAIDRLSPSDSFEVIQFNSRSEALFGQPRVASARYKREALAYVARLHAQGGTEMAPALETAFATPGEEPGTLRQVVFITDGAVANEEALLALIHERLLGRRLFTVGIGSAPNSYFMTEAAHFGRGSFTYIGNEQEVAETMDELFRQLERPAMTDIALSLPVAADLLPSPLPDLYSGQPLIAVMKLDALPGRAEASGRLGDSAWQHGLTLHSAEERSGLGVYWAREKIRHWMRRKAAGMDPQQVRAEVVKLGLAHHLVSAYTSLVAVDVTPVRPDDAATFSHALDSNLPAGWRPPGQPGVTIEASLQLAQGATASQLYLLIGCLLLALAAVLRYCPKGALRCRVRASAQ